jgi:hypothetical protein
MEKEKVREKGFMIARVPTQKKKKVREKRLRDSQNPIHQGIPTKEA